MNHSDLQDQNVFKKHLSEYWASKGITQIKIPQIGGQQLNMFKLYKTVCKKGGGQSVSHNKLWKEIVDEFGLPSTCTSASFTLKNHYQKYLLGYEQRFFFGKDDSADLPELVAGRQRKPMRSDSYGQLMIPNRYIDPRHQQSIQSSLSNQLKRYYDKCDPSSLITYLKRTKIYPVIPQVKHMMMAFQCEQSEQIVYAINTLTLFSVNTEVQFFFSQYPNILDVITAYFNRVYPPKDIFELQCLRNITLALRNLTITMKNRQAVLESDLIQTLLRVFEEKLDQEILHNVADILSSLTSVGLNCKQLFQCIETYLQKDSYEDLETGIDLLRSLVEQKEELSDDIISGKISFFSRLLIHSSLEVRQAVLEIIAYISDKSQKTRVNCLADMKFMERLFGLLAHGTGQLEKQAQLACYILNNIAQLHTPESQAMLRLFERTLLLVSFNDKQLSPITSSILFTLSGRKNANVQADKDKQNQAMATMRMNISRNEHSMIHQEQQNNSSSNSNSEQ